LRRTPISLCEDAGIRGVHFAKDEIIALLDVSDRKRINYRGILTMSQTL
jgi:hypothetical protein